MAGMAGLEPASEGVKVPCLTTWLHPYIARDEKSEGPEPKLRPFRLCYGVGKGTRTLDTRNHNPVLCQLSYTHHIRFFSSLAKIISLPKHTNDFDI